MKTYIVNADFLINVAVWVEAEDEDEVSKKTVLPRLSARPLPERD